MVQIKGKLIMEVAYYNLSGGINQALTKTELGIDTKKVYWARFRKCGNFSKQRCRKAKRQHFVLSNG